MEMKLDTVETNGSQGRCGWVETARVLATLSVILQHVPRACPANGAVLSASLALFFMLSGYFLSPRFSGGIAPGYLARRIGSLVIPYVFWSLLYALMAWIADLLVNSGSPFPPQGGIAATLSSWLGIGSEPLLMPMWFVRDLTIFTLLAGLLSRTGPLRVPLLAFAGLTALFLLNTPGGHQWPSPYMFGNFCFGLLLGSIPDLLRKWAAVPKPAHFAVILSFAVLVALSLLGNAVYEPLTALGVAALSSAAVLLEATRLGRWMAGQGKATFFIYCSHVPVICILMNLESHTVPWSPWVWWCLVPVIFLACLGLRRLMEQFVPAVLRLADSK